MTANTPDVRLEIGIAEMKGLAGEGVSAVRWFDGDATPSSDLRRDAAVLLVTEVTDAVKVVQDGRIVGSVDRDAVYEFRGVYLGADVLAVLPAEAIAHKDLHERVIDAGFSWVITLV